MSLVVRSALALLALATVPAAAHAACTVTLAAPMDGVTVSQSPTLRWTGDCVDYRVWYSPSGTFTTDRSILRWQPRTSSRMVEGTWDSMQLGAWADGVYWKVQGRDSAGVMSFSGTTRFLAMDPDIDDDGWSVGELDCDDAAATVYPGAAEVADDGIDQDCDGADLVSTPLTVDELVAGDLVITEIMNDPAAVSDTYGEWFEVYNASGSAVDLLGLLLSDYGTDSSSVTASVVVAAGEHVVLGRNGDLALNGDVALDVVYTGFTLANTDDEVVLSNASGLIDAVAYDGGTLFPDGPGFSLSLDPSAMDELFNDDGANWCEGAATWGTGADLGSPGAVNPTCP